MNFKIGDRVTCVNAFGSELVEGRDYIIYGVKKCSCSVVVDVGLTDTAGTMCYNCHTLLGRSGTRWFYKDRFAIVEHKTRYKVVKIAKELTEQELILN